MFDFATDVVVCLLGEKHENLGCVPGFIQSDNYGFFQFVTFRPTCFTSRETLKPEFWEGDCCALEGQERHLHADHLSQ